MVNSNPANATSFCARFSFVQTNLSKKKGVQTFYFSPNQLLTSKYLTKEPL